MVRVLSLLAVVAILIAGAAFITLACSPSEDGAPAGPGVEFDIDTPKRPKTPPTFKAPAPAPKPPKVGKFR